MDYCYCSDGINSFDQNITKKLKIRLQTPPGLSQPGSLPFGVYPHLRSSQGPSVQSRSPATWRHLPWPFKAGLYRRRLLPESAYHSGHIASTCVVFDLRPSLTLDLKPTREGSRPVCTSPRWGADGEVSVAILSQRRRLDVCMDQRPAQGGSGFPEASAAFRGTGCYNSQGCSASRAQPEVWRPGPREEVAGIRSASP